MEIIQQLGSFIKKGTQQQVDKNSSRVIRYVQDDIFLIKIKINKVTFKDNQPLNQSKKQKIYGKFMLRTYEPNPFRVDKQSYENLYLRSLISNQSKQLDLISKTSQKKSPIFDWTSLNNFLKNDQEQIKKQNNSNSLKKTIKNKLSRRSTVSMLQNYKNLPNNYKVCLIDNSVLNSQNDILQQRYNIQYKRKVEAKAEIIEEHNIFNQLFNIQKLKDDFQQTNAYENQKIIYINQIFKQNVGFMFATTKDAILQFKFQQTRISKQQKSKQQLQKNSYQTLFSDIFNSKFPIRQFLNNPFLKHKIQLKLKHKRLIQKNKTSSLQLQKEFKNIVKSIVQLQLYCVPGNKNFWGKLNITDIEIFNLNRNYLKNNKLRTYVNLRIQFPDLINAKKIRKINEDLQCFELKKISLEPYQNPRWDQDFIVAINPRKNKLKIQLFQIVQANNTQSMIGQVQIDLLMNGYLFDNIDMSKCLKLTRKEQNLIQNMIQTKSKGQRAQVSVSVADLKIDFRFQINKNDIQQKDSKNYKGQNSFVGGMGVLL